MILLLEKKMLESAFSADQASAVAFSFFKTLKFPHIYFVSVMFSIALRGFSLYVLKPS